MLLVRAQLPCRKTTKIEASAPEGKDSTVPQVYVRPLDVNLGEDTPQPTVKERPFRAA